MNPFNPSFGVKPERYLGREEIKDQLLRSIDNPNSLWRNTLITGVRGSGKTTLLSDVNHSLREMETVRTVLLSPADKFLDSLLSLVYDQLPLDARNELSKVAGLTIGPLSLTKKEDPQFLNNYRYQMEQLLRILKRHELKLVILLDEVQKISSELQIFVASHQQFLQENYPIWLFMAGLPQAVSDTMNDKILSFFRRANRVSLPKIPIPYISLDYSLVFPKVQETILEEAAQFTQGFPYLIQLAGYFFWESLEGTGQPKKALEFSKKQSQLMFEQNVLGSIFQDLSEVDQQFLYVMASFDSDKIAVKDIKLHFGLNKSPGYFNRYRTRLIDSGLISQNGHGFLKFEMPFLKLYLQKSLD